ncbi:MAG: DUF421 domain-containing protein [Epulopiscium sp.]|nr:DUF421 domain-containing protein [Candidatus Epulonipiscium sp.]
MSTYLQLVMQIVFTYISLLIITRLMGKREISQLSFFDYVIGITIGSSAATLSVDTSNTLVKIFIVLATLGLLQIITSYLSLKSISFRKLTIGSKTMLIKNGRIIEDKLKKERLNIDELTTKLREKNVFNLSDVEFAFLETNGDISIQQKPNKQVLTPSHLKLPTTYSGIGNLIIREGQIDEDALYEYGLTRSWLMSKLGEKGVFDLAKISFAQVDNSGNLFIDSYDYYDNLPSNDTSNQILLAKLNKVRSDLLTYHNETDNKQAKILYESCAENIEHIIQYFHHYLRDKDNSNKIINPPKH